MRKWLLALAASMALSACGGGTDSGYDDDDNQPGANQPQAVIRAAVDGVVLSTGASVAAGRTVTLDAGASAGGVIGYQWMLTKVPAGSQAVLANASSAVASMVPDVPGDYQVSLSVGNGSATAAAALEFIAVNDEPVAVVPATLDALVGTVQLDGSASVPPNGGQKSGLVYAWKLVSVPPDSTLRKIPDAEAARAITRFTADVEGKYEAQLIVSYGERQSATARTVVNVTKPYAKPVVKVKTIPSQVTRDERLALDASESTAASGGALQYRWSLTSIPAGVAGTEYAPELEGSNQAVAYLLPKTAGSYWMTLQIFDGLTMSSTQFGVNVVKPASAGNTAPVARVNLQLYNPSAEGEKGKLELNGRDSFDIDETSNMGLTYEWKLLRAPENFTLEGTAHDLNVRYAYFTPTEFGEYEFEFRVADPQGAWSQPVRQTYTIMNGANRAPAAKPVVAAGNTNVGVGSVVTLDGAGSSDPDSNRLSYQWTLLDKPDGSQAQLSSTTAVRPAFTADKAGPYSVQLIVVDSHGVASSAVKLTVFAKARNMAPQVRPAMGSIQYGNQGRVIYEEDQPLLIDKRMVNRKHTIYTPQGSQELFMDHWHSFNLYSNASDPDGDTLTYLWALVSEPANSVLNKPETLCPTGGSWNYTNADAYDVWWDKQIEYRQWDCKDIQVAPSVNGKYEFDLMVSDGVDRIGPYRMVLYAASRADYPSLLLEDLSTMHLWSNNEQKLVLQNTRPTYQAEQLIFPVKDVYDPSVFAGNMPSGLGLAPEHPFEGDFIFKTLTLTASDRDYTITGLKAYDKAGVESPRFIGLEDGQVIRKGQTVQFQLAWPIVNRPEICELSKIVNKDGLVWEFGVAERAGWTFIYNPGNGVKSFTETVRPNGAIVRTCVK